MEFALKAALARLSMTQKDLADRLGLHENTVANWNTKKVPGYAIAYFDLMDKFDSYKRKMIEAASGE